MPDFNLIAPFYDRLKFLVFGETLENASSIFLREIPGQKKVLILGGGSGYLLCHMKASHEVIYLEASEKMIRLAKQRKYKASVDFLCADVLDLDIKKEFDVLITPFVLDCFGKRELDLVFDKLYSALTPGGWWLHADFYPQNRIQKLFIGLMYLFFKISAKLKVKKVPDFKQYFSEEKFIKKKNVSFQNAMVHSYLYEKIA